jgi:CRP-like cAMP-binding protein
MESRLLEYFSKLMPLTREESDAIAGTMLVRDCKKGTVLLREGQVSVEAYFVLEGCVRQYYLVDGEERTINFFTEGQWVTSVHSFRNKVPVGYFMACCEDCALVVGNREKEEDLYRRFPKFEAISRMVMEKVLAEQQNVMESYFIDTPEQRYLKLLNARPDLIQRIPQYLLASYVGVKPESLSRIRKRISSK